MKNNNSRVELNGRARKATNLGVGLVLVLVLFVLPSFNTLSAQSTISTVKSEQVSSTSKVDFVQGNIEDVAGTGIDASEITSNVEAAILYTKNAYEAIASKQNKNLDDNAGGVFYREFSRQLEQAQGKGSADVQSSLVVAYQSAKAKLQPKGQDILSALDAVVAKTVTNLQ